MDFLVFVNFRKNVAIEHFTLYKVEDTTYNKVSIGKFFSNQTGYDSKVENSIIFEDLTHDEISRLFSCISIQRKQDSYNDSYIPENAKKYRSFNWIDWLNTALSFEGEYCKRYHLAHGDIVEMSDSNVVNFILMRVFIYCFILERADISKDVRKKAVEKLFCI